jgi:hypothetical protein
VKDGDIGELIPEEGISHIGFSPEEWHWLGMAFLRVVRSRETRLHEMRGNNVSNICIDADRAGQ